MASEERKSRLAAKEREMGIEKEGGKEKNLRTYGHDSMTFYRRQRHWSISDFFVLLVEKPLGHGRQYAHMHTMHTFANIRNPVAMVDAIPMVNIMPHVPFLSYR